MKILTLLLLTFLSKFPNAFDRVMYAIDVSVEVGRSEPLYFAADEDLLECARKFVEHHALTHGDGCDNDKGCVAKHLAERMSHELRTNIPSVGDLVNSVELDIVTTTRGLLMMTSMNDNLLARNLKATGTWEEPAIELLAGCLLAQGDIVVDAGANIGAHALAFAATVAPRSCIDHQGGIATRAGWQRNRRSGRGPSSQCGHVVAIEPVRSMFYLLCTNAALNQAFLAPTALRALHNAADWPPAREILPVGIPAPGVEQNLGMTSILEESGTSPELRPGDPGAYYEEVETVTIDGALGWPGDAFPDDYLREDGTWADDGRGACPRLIKIDIEGMEERALAGARHVIRRCLPKPPVIYAESNDMPGAVELHITARRLADRFCSAEKYKAYSHIFPYEMGGARGDWKDPMGKAESKNLLCLPWDDVPRLEACGWRGLLQVLPGYEHPPYHRNPNDEL